jgi:uncharacterized phage protein (TIGR01671 family)
MREILFRGKTKDGRWIYGDLWHRPYGNNSVAIVSFTEDTGTTGGLEVIPETVGQYTGLKDKNGVEIYEGDIVQCSQKGQKMKGIVTFNKGMWSWQYGKERNDSYLYEVVKRWKGVIVGNIWEDGELIYDCKKTEKD